MANTHRLAIIGTALAIAVAGCTDSGDESSSGSPNPETADATDLPADATVEPADPGAETDGAIDHDGEPVQGGTLLVAGGPDVLFLDPAAAYSKADYQIQRAIHRGLFDYAASENLDEATTPLPDIAEQVPTRDNGGISEDGLTYTIILRDGVMWNAPSGERPVVAEDAIRGLRRMCNPVQGAYPRKYYTDTIVGFEDYCTSFGSVEPTVDAIRQYVESGTIEGAQALDDRTLEFTLTQPAADFIEILALSRFAAPQPVEYLDHLPDSPELRQNTVANGPYQIAEYVPDQHFELVRNPAWDPATDDLRAAWVDEIDIAMGQEDTTVSQQIMAGTVDMQWGETIVPTSEIPALVAADDDRLFIGGNGSIRPYLAINTLSPNQEDAFTKVEVRQALNFAVDRAAVQQILGGPELAQIATSILPPEVPGAPVDNPLDLPDTADPERARELLADAGYPDGLTVKLLYEEEDPERDIAAVLEQDLTAAGFAVELIGSPRNQFYSDWLLNPEVTESGGWDIAPTTWFADYLSGRAYMVPMLDGRGYEGGSPNYGGYNNDDLNTAIDDALAATSDDKAEAHWAAADNIAMTDAAWVPIAFTKTPTLHGDRVGGFVYHFPPNNGDFVNVWLKE